MTLELRSLTHSPLGAAGTIGTDASNLIRNVDLHAPIDTAVELAATATQAAKRSKRKVRKALRRGNQVGSRRRRDIGIVVVGLAAVISAVVIRRVRARAKTSGPDTTPTTDPAPLGL